MLSAATKDKLRTLKLYGMLKALEEQESQTGSCKNLDFEERIGLLVDRELTEQDNRRMMTRLKAAGFRQGACLKDLDYNPKREFDKNLIKKLATGQWVNDRLNILITGASGPGKVMSRRRWPIKPICWDMRHSIYEHPGCITTWPWPEATDNIKKSCVL